MTPSKDIGAGCCDRCVCIMGTTHPNGICNCEGCSNPNCPCHKKPQEKLCEHGNESWDCTACIRKALTPQEKKTCRFHPNGCVNDGVHAARDTMNKVLDNRELSSKPPLFAALPHTEEWAEEFENVFGLGGNIFDYEGNPRPDAKEKIRRFFLKMEKEAYQRGLRDMKAAAIEAMPTKNPYHYEGSLSWNACLDTILYVLRALPINEQER